MFLGPFIHSERFEQVTVVDDGILIVRNGKVGRSRRSDAESWAEGPRFG